MRSGARAMLRKWGKRAADRFHRFYISFQNPKCLQETKSSRRLITKIWKEEMGKGYKEESMDQRKRNILKDMKEEINDLSIFALLLQVLIVCHVVWCLREAVMGRGWKQRGDLESGCDHGALVLLIAWPWDPCVPASRIPKGLSVSPLQWKSGPLTSSILLPPSTCLCVTRNEAVPTCSSSRQSLPPFISPLVTVPFLPPWTSNNPRVLQQHWRTLEQQHIGRRTMGVWLTSPISPLFN